MGKIENGHIHILHESQTYEYAKNGWFDDLEVDGYKMKVYNIWVQTLLFWGSISEDEKLKNIEIDSEKYRNCYMNGYKEGQEYFIKYFKDNPNNSSVKSLIYKILDKNREVAKIINTNEYILNNDVFEKYGYNSGIYYEMKKYEKENIHDFDEVMKLKDDKGKSEEELDNSSKPIFLFKKKIYYNYFLDYKNNYIIEPFVDYSYLFQRMLKEELISRITHIQFMEWLKENEFITPDEYSNLSVQGQFRSFSKSESKPRKNNFNITFKLN